MNMNDTVRIVCENTGRSLFVNRGTSLLQIAEILSLGEREDRPFLAAYVNNRLKELDFAVYSPVSIRYVDITHFEGMRVYQRTLFFVLQKAVYDLFPERKLHIKHSVAKGFYCEIEGMEDLSDEQIVRIKERMRAIVAQDLPIVRQKVTSAEAEAMYEALGLDDKIALLRTRPHLYVTVYSMADLVGYFYGALAVSSGYVSRFDLHPYYKGFRMALPQRTDPTKLEELVDVEESAEEAPKKTELELLIERIQKIQQELPAHNVDISPEEQAFTQAAVEQREQMGFSRMTGRNTTARKGG